MRGRIPLGLFAGAALVVALGAAGVLWATSGGSAGDTARLVPANAAVYATINTDGASRQWVQMAQLLSRLGLDSLVRDARDNGADVAGLDWEQDIAPFLGGEASIAVTSLDRDQPGLTIILATRDGGRAWDHATGALERMARRGARPDDRTYRGVTIRTYAQGGPAGSLSIGRKDTYLILATSPEQVQAVLDLEAGKGDALGGQERFKSARAAVTADPLLFLYVNPAALGEAARAFTPGLLGPGAMYLGTAPGGSMEDALRQAGMERAAFAFAASAEQKGVRFEWQTVGIDQSRAVMRMPQAPGDSRFARRAPADSLLFLAGTDLYGGVVRGVTDTLKRLSDGDTSDGSPFADFRRELDDLNRRLGFDLERDLLAHLTGEYAVALGTGDFDGDDFWALAMSGVDDADAVGRAMQAFGAWERREGRHLTTSNAGGVNVTHSRPATGTDDAYAYALTGDELLAGYGDGTVERAVARKDTLADDPDYREALSSLPGGRTLTAFVNLKRAVEMGRQAAGSDDDLDWDALGKLRYLAAALTQGGDRAGGVAFLRIAGE